MVPVTSTESNRFVRESRESATNHYMVRVASAASTAFVFVHPLNATVSTTVARAMAWYLEARELVRDIRDLSRSKKPLRLQ